MSRQLRDSVVHHAPWALAAVTAIVVLRPVSQGQALVDIADLSPHETVTAGFALDANQDVRVRAVGADGRRRGGFGNRDRDERDPYWTGNAWILDAQSREVVWELRDSDAERERGGTRRFEGTVRLPAGDYVAHYASYSGTREGWNGSDRRHARGWEDDGISEDFMLAIEGSGRPLRDADLARLREAFNRTSFVSFVGLEDEVSERTAFEVLRPTEIEVYAIGEMIDESVYDYAWIVDMESRRPLWRFGDRRSQHAGGAAKNRQYRFTITLEPGTYAALAVTDDSHDGWDWNAAPPFDPNFWGLTLRVTDPGALGNIRMIPYREAATAGVIVDLTRMGDNEAPRRGFTLTRSMAVRIHAVGEGMDGRMYDYGWIVNAATRAPVWAMAYHDTDPAGGADKNRTVDETIRLEAGDYVAYYVTDGSHSYDDWNSAAPAFEETWGLTISGGEGYDASAVREYDEANNPNVLAQLVGIRDHDRRRARFAMERDGTVRIYAIGEGTSGEMYDYAWIENARGRTVWEMRYRETERAGGARKNRVLDDTIRLPAGEYVLHYESDGSHSAEDWNDAPPRDPFHYGVTVYRR